MQDLITDHKAHLVWKVILIGIAGIKGRLELINISMNQREEFQEDCSRGSISNAKVGPKIAHLSPTDKVSMDFHNNIVLRDLLQQKTPKIHVGHVASSGVVTSPE